MHLIITDILKYFPNMHKTYLLRTVKPTGDYRLVNGALYHIYTPDSIRTAMIERRNVALTATRLPRKSREESLDNIHRVLNALNKFEKEHNEQNKN